VLVMTLTSLLPIRFADDLRIEVDADAAGKVLTPAEALALGERLIHQGARRQVEQRRGILPLALGKSRTVA